jgi:telomerase reverse transcriptase
MRKKTSLVTKTKVLGNQRMRDFYGMFNQMKELDRSVLGAGVFSVDGIYEKLKAFKKSCKGAERFYFAKADIKASFDSIDQESLVSILKKLVTEVISYEQWPIYLH